MSPTVVAGWVAWQLCGVARSTSVDKGGLRLHSAPGKDGCAVGRAEAVGDSRITMVVPGTVDSIEKVCWFFF
jgi:hypothetical protein